MSSMTLQYKDELLNEIEGLSAEKLKQIIDFVCFIKTKDVIDLSQSYFWTKKWQSMENEVEKDKALGKIIGDGTVESLLNEIKK